MKFSHAESGVTSILHKLGAEALEVFQHVVEHQQVDGDELRDRFAPADGPDGEAVVDRLLELRLLKRSVTRPGMLVAGIPEAASGELLAPVVRRLNECGSQVEAARERLAAFQRIYDLARPAAGGSGGVKALNDLDEVRAVITELAAGAKHEILTSQPGGARKDEVLKESLARTESVLDRGVRMRTLYQHTAQFSTVTVEYVEHVSQLGAEIRTLGDGFMRMLAFDQTAAVIAMRDSEVGALLLTDPGLLDFAIGAFERAWTSATPFPERYSQERVLAISDDMKLAIVRMLIQGLEDRAIARRMGISLRTCQRHVSDIMDKIGARSRLQAGFLINEMGLHLEVPSEQQ
ncbi:MULTISPECIES: helix-turn-helix transcriptional regulator [unclassified Streptomyces]|uniref:helix-turn-helix transcriptional regulator n=1 Tax=unclassified Streptomyces TaxID=2593676 RepID=UPI00036797A0|nr:MULTISPECIES: helix-turn-helix transcriptional regulator [unclassified Streptomyces]MYQ81793.1 LuxR family transcriptional regulator [Streptomyces sp. SID4923]